MTRWESFWIGLLAGFLIGAAVAGKANAGEHYGGVNTISRHLGTDRKYNEENFGLFYEHRSSADWGQQLGFYENSYKRTTVYAAAIWQPVHLGPLDIGGLIGAATGYDDNPVILGGAYFTLRMTRDVAAEVLWSPAVVGLQFRFGF